MRRRAAALALATGASSLVWVVASLAAGPATAADCGPVPIDPPGIGCPLPASPSPSPSASEQPSTPAPAPTATPTPAEDQDSAVAPSEAASPTPVPEASSTDNPADATGAAGIAALAAPVTQSTPLPVALAQPVAAAPLATSPVPLGGSLVLITVGLVAVALGMTTLATAARSARHTTSPVSARPGGSAMSSTRRWRLITGAGLLGLSAIVGVIGWLKISDEPLLNRQVPYFASTGIAVVILAVAGGAMLVAEQMRTDDRRLDDIEDAVRTLAASVAPAVEKPARLRDPKPESAVVPEPVTNVKPVTPVTPKPRAPRKSAAKSGAK